MCITKQTVFKLKKYINSSDKKQPQKKKLFVKTLLVHKKIILLYTVCKNTERLEI